MNLCHLVQGWHSQGKSGGKGSFSPWSGKVRELEKKSGKILKKWSGKKNQIVQKKNYCTFVIFCCILTNPLMQDFLSFYRSPLPINFWVLKTSFINTLVLLLNFSCCDAFENIVLQASQYSLPPSTNCKSEFLHTHHHVTNRQHVSYQLHAPPLVKH